MVINKVINHVIDPTSCRSRKNIHRSMMWEPVPASWPEAPHDVGTGSRLMARGSRQGPATARGSHMMWEPVPASCGGNRLCQGSMMWEPTPASWPEAQIRLPRHGQRLRSNSRVMARGSDPTPASWPVAQIRFSCHGQWLRSVSHVGPGSAQYTLEN